MPRTTPEGRFVDFGRRLRIARELRGKEIAELSRLVGISKSALYAYEAGARVPDSVGPDSDALRLCKLLNVEFNWLYAGDDQWLQHHPAYQHRAYELQAALKSPPTKRMIGRPRRQLLLSEKVKIWHDVERRLNLKKAARQRQYGHIGGKRVHGGEPVHMREEMQKVTGISGKTLVKAIAIVDAAERDPDMYGHLLEEMNRTNKAAAVYEKLKEMQDRQVKEMQAAKPRRARAARVTGLVPAIEKFCG